MLDVLTIALFLGALGAPLVDLAVRPAEARSPKVELRQPAPFPETSGPAAWVDFPEAFEDWWNDSFGLRDVLLRWHGIVKMDVFGVSPSERMVLGREGWIFSTVERSIDVYRGLAPLTTKELEWWRIALESRRDWLAGRGIQYVYALAPSKQAVYPEHMPARLNVVGRTRVDQLIDHLGAHSGLQVLDLRAALRAAKQHDDPVGGNFAFYPLGTHWSARGAFAATRAIRDALVPRFPRLGTVELPEPRWERDATTQGDSWAARLYVADRLRQSVWSLDPASLPEVELTRAEEPARRAVTYTQSAPELPRALVLHDSFGQGLYDLLPRLFARTVFVWRSEFDLGLIERERPDVVIQLFVDRTLVSLAPTPVGDAGRDFARAQFERSQSVLLESERGLAELEPYRDMQLVPEEGGIALDAETSGALVLLPELEYPEDRNPIVHLAVTSPVATTLDLLYQTRADPTYKRTRVYELTLAPGANELFVELLVPDLAGRLALRPGREPGRYVLTDLEVRAVPR
jgi:hypothetical protein